jgi:hypothetical protein
MFQRKVSTDVPWAFCSIKHLPGRYAVFVHCTCTFYLYMYMYMIILFT